MNHTLPLTDTLYCYLQSVSLRQPPLLQALGEETSRHRLAKMQSAPEQAQLLGLLAQLLGAQRIIEVGVFTGYSTLALALACPTARILACDISAEFTAIGQRYWRRAGVAERIELQLQPAQQTLQTRLAAGEAGQYDLAFIDADKPAYPDYYELCLQLLRPGGLIVLDNMFLGGRVAEPTAGEPPGVAAIRALNLALRDDMRIDLSLLPIGDGVTLARKR